MPQFSYEATDATGRTLRGTVDAEHRDAAVSALQLRGMTVARLHQEPAPMPMAPAPEPATETVVPAHGEHAGYFPILKTLRLYAGWLLAYYAVVYLLGWYQYTRDLPFEVPFVESLMLSPLVLQFTFAAFLFLLAGAVNDGLRIPRILQAVTWVAVIALFIWYRMNIL